MAGETRSEILDIIVRLKNLSKNDLDYLENQIKGVRQEASVTSKTLITLRKGVSGLGSAIFSLKGAFVGLGIGYVAKSFVDAASTAEQYRTRLTTLTGSVKEANELFKDMSDFASGVSFSYEEIMGSATNLTAVMKGGTEEVRQYMPLIADLAAASGLTIEETTGQVIRMYSAGAAAADMFRERGVLAMLGFQAGVSYTAEETQKKLVEAWEAPASKFRDASTALAQTWDGLLSMMGDAWFQFRNEVMQSGIFDWIRAALSVLLDNINAVKKEGDLSVIGKSISDFVVGALEKAIYLVAALIDAFSGLKMLWTTLKYLFAGFAQVVNEGMVYIAKAVDAVVQSINKVREALGMEKIALASEVPLYEQQVKYWEDIQREAEKVLVSYAGQETALSKVGGIIDQIRAKAKEYADAAKDATDRIQRPTPQAPTVTPQVQLSSDLSRLTESNKTELEMSKALYDQGIIQLQDYLGTRRKVIESEYNAEKAVLEQKLASETNVDKQQQINDKLFALQEQHERDMLSLTLERVEMEKAAKQDLADNELLMAELKVRTAQNAGQELQAQNAYDLLALQQQQEAELQALIDHNATVDQIEEARRAHELEKEELLNEQKLALVQKYYDGVQSTLGSLDSFFGDMYKASGEKAKEAFYAQKAVQIAQTLMSTYASAQSAYESYASLPYVGNALGIAAAAAAVAAGLARVNMIRSQTLATGGEVGGHSPTDTSDNVPIWATAGEFVHNVAAVKHYGVGVMQALNNRLIPKDMLTRFGLPGITRMHPSYHYATGGSVGTGEKKIDTQGTPKEERVNVVNVIDPQMMDEYLASTTGERTLLNVLSRNQFQVQRALGLSS